MGEQLEHYDTLIIGAGAAGLMAATWAGRTQKGARHLLVDSQTKIGAKILVAGGGRCNVTHFEVHETAFAGSTHPAIRKVLRAFDVPRVIHFFRELGVTLKQEDSGKLFPSTDSARTVLHALVQAAENAGVELRHPCKVLDIQPTQDPEYPLVAIFGDGQKIRSRRIILATGGKALPKSGSDGTGLEIAKRLGHTLTSRIHPSLVALTLPKGGHFLTTLSGVSAEATITLRSSTNKVLKRFTGPTLCTHFGLSGPAVMNISRYYLATRYSDPDAYLEINWLPSLPLLDTELRSLSGKRIGNFLSQHLPARLANALCTEAQVNPNTVGNHLTRGGRRNIIRTVTALRLPITGDRGFRHAEVTAGGVPLAELRLNTMESRRVPGLHLCGEICDVDGQIGGFNFQWAWASGFVAGTADTGTQSEYVGSHSSESE